MKRGLFIPLGLLGLPVLGTWLAAAPRQAPPAPVAAVAPPAAVAPVTAMAPGQPPDGVNIFQRTFWRSPAAADHIINATRREWTGDDGIPRWESFIVVQASPELLREVRDDNAFRLVAADPIAPPHDAPAWFAFETAEVSCLRAPTGRLQLCFNKSTPLTYAIARGVGFRPSAPETPTPPATASLIPAGRLPNLSPLLPSPL